MQNFTGYEYLLIDIANHWGLDKELFEPRIQWVEDNLLELEDLAKGRNWKEKPLYLKAVMALRSALRGEDIGHLVGFDAICSGMQIMSVITGCEKGANATGLIDPNRRADAYTDCTSLVQKRVPTFESSSRDDIKDAVMTSLYGSIKQPEQLFGEGTKELQAFKESMVEMAPGACRLLEVLRSTWNPEAEAHSWKLPDGYDAHVVVTTEVEKRIEVDELNHTTFTYHYEEVGPKDSGVSNIANVIHSIDAYIVNTLERLCNYDANTIKAVSDILINESFSRLLNGPVNEAIKPSPKLAYYLEQYERSEMPDPTLLPFLTKENVRILSDKHLDQLVEMTDQMLKHNPFPVITNHDAFYCHANNMNYLRFHYRETMARLAESEILSDLLTQLFGKPGKWTKLSQGLGDKVRKSNYGIC